MCTRPITITKNTVFGTKSYTVPCGKCAECVNKKRSEIAALSVHQAYVSGDVRFFTLTYNDDSCPVAIFDPGEDRVVGFQSGVSAWKDDKGVFFNSVHEEGGLFYTPSLRREDVKLWLKQFRSYWKREHGEYPVFKYLFFGEYGDRRGRPHYHGLIYGLTAEQTRILWSMWRDRFGFALAEPAPDKTLSSEDITAISQYVSKYISKGIHQRFADLLPFVERPRRQSSLDFGQFSEEEMRKYSNFMKGAIFSDSIAPADSSECHQLMIYLGSLIEENASSFKEFPMLCPKN